MSIEIKIRGHRAVITKVLPRLDRWGEWNELVAKVDFPDGVFPGTNCLAMGIALPAMEYTREELIELVTYDIERQCQIEADERKKRRKREEAEAQLKDLADKRPLRNA